VRFRNLNAPRFLCHLGPWLAPVLALWVVCLRAAPAADARLGREAVTLLRDECFSCHGEARQKGGLSLLTRDHVLRGGEEGPVVQEGRPKESRLLASVLPGAEPHMPPRKQLSPGQIRTLRQWIQRGLPWDARAVTDEPEPRPVSMEAPAPSFGPVGALAVDPAGRRLAVARAGRVEVFDLREPGFPRLAASPDVSLAPVESLAWSRDGRWLASGSFRRVSLRDPSTLAVDREVTEGLTGRILSVEFSADGSRLALGDGGPGLPGRIRLMDVAAGRILRSWKAHADSVFDLEFSRDGTRLLSAGGDALVKVWDPSRDEPLAVLEGHAAAVVAAAFNTNATQVVSGGIDRQLKVWDIATREKIVTLGDSLSAITAVAWPGDSSSVWAATERGAIDRYSQLKAHTGEQSSATGEHRRIADLAPTVVALAVAPGGGPEDGRVAAADFDGRVRVWDGQGKALGELGAPPAVDSRVQAPAPPAPPAPARPKGQGRGESGPPSFVRDVLPVLHQAGCASGGCHSKPEGQGGFKLSVFAYDPAADHAEIVRDARGRRVFPAAPEESLLLLKPLGLVPHEGGQRFAPGSPAHRLLARWIRAGMPYVLTNEPALKSIAVSPAEGTYRKGARQRLTVEARYSDGSAREVTALAAYESSDKELARVDESGRVAIGRLTGQGVVVARYMGLVAASALTVPADRVHPARVYAAIPTNNFIDSLALAQFRRLGLLPSELCTDAEFLRRAKLDAVGLLPTPEEVRAFLADPSPDKRRRFIDQVLEHPAYADYWANQWADLLRPNPDRVGVKSVFLLDQWLREQFRANRPYDQFVRDLLLAEGSNHRSGPAVVYRDRRDPPELTTQFSQLFLGTRLECAKCHHHPNEKWGQDDFYQLAAYFGPVRQKGAGLSPPISAGTETFFFAPGGTVKHPVSGAVMTPRPPEGPELPAGNAADPRRHLADWLTLPDNPFFARAAVNRVWGRLFGRGLVHPVDDFRSSNPCANPALLDALAADFASHGHDFKHLLRTVMGSRLYQLSSRPNETNLGDTRQFSRSYRRRLPAEVLVDAVGDATGVPETFSAVPAGGRAMQTWSYKIPSHFLDAFGRPNSSSDCPCERDAQLSVVQSLHLMNSKALQAKLADPKGRLRRLAAGDLDEPSLVDELYLLLLGRPPADAERKAALGAFSKPEATRETALEDLFWALLNTPEFVLNH
jgi:WD40 repeat protein